MQQSNSSNKEYQNHKIIILGDVAVGKTSILRKYIKSNTDETYKPTIAPEYYNKFYQNDQYKINICFWDTAGQERYRSLTKLYFKDAKGIIIVYDVTESKSPQQIKTWLKVINNYSPSNQLKILILGNKIDLENGSTVKIRTIKEVCEQFVRQLSNLSNQQITYYEVSAKTGDMLNIAIQQFVQQIIVNKFYEQKKSQLLRQISKKQQSAKKKFCCI